MTDLRAPVVDAVAAEILRWGIKPEKLPAGEKHLAGLAVDVVLDTLADRADEWAEAGAARSGFEPHTRVMAGLITVLRGDT